MSENSTNELLIRMEEKYKKMSKGQKRLADYVTENYDKAVFLTAARLGEVVGVSESTVVRFATQLGYKGYPGFQKALEQIEFHSEDGGYLWADQSVGNSGNGASVRY